MDKDIITKKDIEDILSSGSKYLNIQANAIITPLAMDLINKEGIKLE